MLHCEILNRLRHEKPENHRGTKKFEFRKSPIYIVSTSDPKARSVELPPRNVLESRPAAPGTEVSPTIQGRGTMFSNIESSNENASSTAMYPRSLAVETFTGNDTNQPYNMTSLTQVVDNNTTVLPQGSITLALEEEQLLDFEQCRRWLQDFPALARYAKVQGVYRSNSTLLLLSILVVIWDWIPEDPACAFIGYVYSENLCQESL